MADAFVLAIDQGTTNSKAVLIDRTGNVVARGSAPLPIYFPQPGWVEQNPDELWQSVVQAIRHCLEGVPGRSVAVIGVSSQRESVLAWHAATGQALGPCISWQCRRTAAVCDQLRAEGHEPDVIARTGLPLDPMFPATKVAWLLANIRRTQPHLSESDVRIGTVDSWLLWQLTGGKRHACDESNAARTQLYNIGKGQWDETLGNLFGVPLTVLPEALPSNADFGVTSGIPGVPDGIQIHAMLGDSHAALFGHGVTAPGTVKATYGTGSSLMTLIDGFAVPEGGITTTIAWSLGSKRTYALEGNILVSGASLPWASELLGLCGDVAALSKLAQTVTDTGGVYFVPALVGLGAPYWDSSATGLFTGMSFSTGSAQLALTVFEALTFQVTDVLEVMRAQAVQPFACLLADGGASSNPFVMQLQADQADLPVVTSEVPEASARGAAFMAGLSVSFWDNLSDILALHQKQVQFDPAMPEKLRQQKQTGWRQAIARTRYRPEQPYTREMIARRADEPKK